MGTARRLAEPPSSLPTLPAVAARIVALFASPDYRIADVVQALEHDPPVTSRVLKLANSAYYGFARRVDRLEQAVVLLGGVTVQALALATGVLDLWRDAPPESVRGLWIHAYLTAEGSRYLARRRPDDAGLHPDALFLAGLLHDVGKIWFLAQAPEEYAELLARVGGPELRGEEAGRFGEHHGAAGETLLSAWGFPPSTTALVGFHHGPPLRADLRQAQALLGAANAAAGGTPADTEVPQALMEDVASHLEARRGAAEAFVDALV
ncbi:MAG: HDOD domain-containing protein [Deltaproteobacteria bacterium]|nr:HDOD domain-containing protein [Deltaproteobacteria bacterium]